MTSLMICSKYPYHLLFHHLCELSLPTPCCFCFSAGFGTSPGLAHPWSWQQTGPHCHETRSQMARLHPLLVKLTLRAIQQAPKDLHKKKKKAGDKQEPSESNLQSVKLKQLASVTPTLSRLPSTSKVSHTDLTPLKHLKFINLSYLQYTPLLGIKHRTLFAVQPMQFSRLSKMTLWKTLTRRKKSRKSLVLFPMSNCLSLSLYPKKLLITMLRMRI